MINYCYFEEVLPPSRGYTGRTLLEKQRRGGNYKISDVPFQTINVGRHNTKLLSTVKGSLTVGFLDVLSVF